MSNGQAPTPEEIKRFEGVTDDDYAQAIGRIIVSFSLLEHISAVAVGMLVNDDAAIGRAVTAPLSFKSRLRVFDALLRAKTQEPSFILQWEELSSLCSQLEESRNGIVHAAWIQRQGDTIHRRFKHRVTFKKRTGVHMTAEQTHPDELHELANTFSRAFDRFCLFLTLLAAAGFAHDHGVKVNVDGREVPIEEKD